MEITEKDVERARKIAHTQHHGQKDALGVAYHCHTDHVAELVVSFGAAYQVRAHLHDTVEDGTLTLASIEEYFGTSIRRSVDAMTRRTGEVYFADYLPRLVLDEYAVVCKYADATHNRGKCHLIKDDKARKSLSKRYDRVRAHLLEIRSDLAQRIPYQDLVFNGEKWVGA